MIVENAGKVSGEQSTEEKRISLRSMVIVLEDLLFSCKAGLGASTKSNGGLNHFRILAFNGFEIFHGIDKREIGYGPSMKTTILCW